MKELNVKVWNGEEFNKYMIEMLEDEFKNDLIYEKERLIGVVRHKREELYTMEDLKVIKCVDEANIIRQVNTSEYSFLVCVVDDK